MLKSTEPTVLSDRDAILTRLAGSDLDVESLEMITAALMADVCDEISTPDDDAAG
jgi:hypothetical protein